MIEVKSFKDMNGKRVSIGDKVHYVALGRVYPESRTVKRIMKAGYFISVYVEEMEHGWYQPKTCVVKARTP